MQIGRSCTPKVRTVTLATIPARQKNALEHPLARDRSLHYITTLTRGCKPKVESERSGGGGDDDDEATAAGAGAQEPEEDGGGDAAADDDDPSGRL